jgi:hypothetical protein
MAVRLGTGGEFSDYENWALHVSNDWREGVGKIKEDAAGFLFGEIESRVPEQLILPSALGCSHVLMFDNAYTRSERPFFMPWNATSYSTITIGGTNNPRRISIPIYVYSNIEGNLYASIEGIAFLGYIPSGIEVTVAVYSDLNGVPNSQLAIGSRTFFNTYPGLQWYYIPLSSPYNVYSPLTGHFVIYPTVDNTSIILGQRDGTPITGRNSYIYDGSIWQPNSSCPFFVYQRPLSGVNYWEGKHIGAKGFIINSIDNSIWTVSGNKRPNERMYWKRIVRYDQNENIWLQSYSSLLLWENTQPVYENDVGNMVLFNDALYIPMLYRWGVFQLSTNTYTVYTAEGAHLFAVWAGYIWRARGNRLWYSADGQTWTEIAGGIGPDDYQIRGMAGLGRNFYVATDEAFYYIAPGDIVVPIMPWGTVSPDNGRNMIAHQNALYIPAAGRIWQFTEDGSIKDIWIERDDDINAKRIGRIAALASLNNFLICGVNGTTDDDPASVWAYTGLGWHHLATIPGNYNIRNIYYDRIRSRLWIASDEWPIFYIYSPDWALNPYNDSNNRYMPSGWVETDRIYASSFDLMKDVESIRVFGDFRANVQVGVYWKDQDSEDWEFLGTFTSDAQEIRWSNPATRPNTRWIKIGLMFQTDDPNFTPRLRAWVLKMMPMVRDRWRWDLTINIADNQQMIDGNMNERYAIEMRNHIESLIESVSPILFEDVDGRRYWVKILGANEALDNYENDGYGNVNWSMKFHLTLEQIESVF